LPVFLVNWSNEDRPKWYRECLEKTEYRYTVLQLSEMSLVQLAALEHYRKELTFSDAMKIIRERQASRAKTS
jgi:hypothetical protein